MKQMRLIILLLFYCLSSNISSAQNEQIMWKSENKVEYTNDETAIKNLVLLKENLKARKKNENFSFRKKIII
ncbi:hypothetical protein N9P53_02270 [Flavobacteriaceae bacterium]|nr:hypothetical protein [Flavobacteriaceae bacterium]